MDFASIQIEVLKEAVNAQIKGGVTKWSACKDGKYCYLCNGYMLVAIPERLCFIDCEHINIKHLWPSTVKTLTDGAEDQKLLADTNTEKIIAPTTAGAEKSKTVHVLEADNGDEVYIDKKIFDTFNKYNTKNPFTLSFKGKDKKSAVYVFFGTALMGIMMPINHI